MGEQTNHSHSEELKIIYIDTLPSRTENINPHSINVNCTVTSLQRVKMEKEKQGNFTVEKPDKSYLSQVIKVNISTDKPC